MNEGGGCSQQVKEVKGRGRLGRGEQWAGGRQAREEHGHLLGQSEFDRMGREESIWIICYVNSKDSGTKVDVVIESRVKSSLGKQKDLFTLGAARAARKQIRRLEGGKEWHKRMPAILFCFPSQWQLWWQSHQMWD